MVSQKSEKNLQINNLLKRRRKTEKPRICVAGNLLGRLPGHVTTQGQIVADHFIADGYSVTAASSRKNQVLRLLDVVWTLSFSFPKTDVLIVEVYSGLAFVLADTASLLAKIFGIPAALVLHGGNLPEFAAKHPTWVRRVLSRAAFVIAPSSYLAQRMSGFGFDIRIVPNVIDIASYTFRLRKQLSPKILWMRSFHPIYNPQMALAVFATVRRKFPNASLVMAGVDKGLESEMKKAAVEMGIGNAVRFPGFLDEAAKRKEFSDADIYINTNRVDNMPVSVIEACAMGLPVVATNVGGLSNLITHGKDGLLIKDNHAGEMAAAIMSLLDDPQLAGKISENGRLLAERSDWKAVRTCWEVLFTEILSREGERGTDREAATFEESRPA